MRIPKITTGLVRRNGERHPEIKANRITETLEGFLHGSL
jgi:hypothetical protein